MAIHIDADTKQAAGEIECHKYLLCIRIKKIR